MKLIKIPKDKYEDYRLSVIFDGYKWDPQFKDDNTIADHVLVLTQKENQEIENLVVSLGKETKEAEKFINLNHNIMKDLKLPWKMKKVISLCKNYDSSKHVRLMRFDFHPCTDGTFMISEVNSDVPGGFAESSLMPKIALHYLEDKHYIYKNFGDVLIKHLVKKIKPFGTIMMVHCTSYTDDRQVMQFLGDELEKLGFKIIYGAVDHLNFKNKKAFSILDNNKKDIDGIIRFNPIEWVVDIQDKSWHGYFNTETPSCNHPIAVITQSKRFPLIWDILEKEGINLSTWRKTLPHTTGVKKAKHKEGYIYKPVWGRVGEGITIKGAIEKKEYDKTIKDVKKHPKNYIAQKQFESLGLLDEDGKIYHVCLGAYYVEGESAGYYGRISKTKRIDSHAKDIPVLIEVGDTNE
ncbi:MAG: glutathionylspermidine synthase family protein [Erysipelotrichaceae bacterium]|nr:glutathionylspermidine synthase family protein [Erysipelotrichaceae bacterium]